MQPIRLVKADPGSFQRRLKDSVEECRYLELDVATSNDPENDDIDRTVLIQHYPSRVGQVPQALRTTCRRCGNRANVELIQLEPSC